MTAQVLASELSTLIQDSKRKNADIRGAAEKSLSELKVLPNTSELQLAADLKRRPNFVRPFLLSCASKNPKFAGTSIVCLQRLIVSNGLAHETLKDVLDVLRDCTSLAQDIQLKILQVLPSLLQNYAAFLTGELLATALHICFLLHASKAAVISNTAAATLQQLIVSVLGKIVQEDEAAAQVDPVTEVPVEDGSVPVRSAALDAFRLLNDICLLTEGHKPTFLFPASMSQNFGLEIIESMLSNYADTVSSHPELIHILRMRLMPFIIRVLSERVMFSTTIRAMRLLPIIFGNMLSVLLTESEMVLSLLNHMLDPDATVLWKRVLCMEIFRGIHAEPTLVRSIFGHFDEQDGKKTIIKDHMGILVRLASEKPSIIGLGQQSSVPASSGQTEEEMDEMAALQAEGVAGTIGVAMTLRASTAPGISARLSTMRVPCLDQLDKSDPPPIPPAYLYTLALTCMNSFSEGLARFLLPFTIPSEARSKRRQRSVKDRDDSRISKKEEDEEAGDTDQRPKLSRSQSSMTLKLPVNPLSLESHVLFSQIQTSSKMVDTCWPALLAAYSTFFHAALDSEYYHALVRSFQKFTQISGLLRLSTPRDAFLTTLGKNAVPSGLVSVHTSGNMTPATDGKESKKGREQQDKEIVNTPLGSAIEKGRPSLDSSRASLNTRNLLCLRALLNLGIALGPVLQTAWSIVLETLQQADLIINHITSQRRQARSGQATPTTANETDFLGDIGNEIAAVRIAATRMFESSADLPDESFLDVISSLSNLFRDLFEGKGKIPDSMTSTPSLKAQAHKTSLSISGSISSLAADPRANLFVVENIGKTVEYNAQRFLEQPPEESGWQIVVDSLLNVIAGAHLDADLRTKASKILCGLVTSTASDEVQGDMREGMRLEGLVALTRQLECLYGKKIDNKSSKSCESEIHWMTLEALKSCLELYGDSLLSGWERVFTIVASVFEQQNIEDPKSKGDLPAKTVKSKSPKLVRSSFGSLQLISSDFLSSVPPKCFSIMLDTVHAFCCQGDDFNISLTATTLFCNMSDYLWQGESQMTLDEFANFEQSTTELPLSPDSRASKSQMLIRILLLLAEITVDSRLEIRQGAIHSIFRIFDSCGERLGPLDWIVCQRRVILQLFAYNERAFRECPETSGSGQTAAIVAWNEAAVVLLDNSSSLLAAYVGELVADDGFTALWAEFAQYLQKMLGRQYLNVSLNVYAALEKILAEIEGARRRDFADCTEIIWNIWRNGNPALHKDPSNKRPDNQPALLAYLRCLVQLYPLVSQDIQLDQLRSVLEQLHACATKSSPTAYRDDIEAMTPLQSLIVRCTQMIAPNVPGSVSELTRAMSRLETLPYDRKLVSGQNGPTFIALSKTAMDMLNKHVTAHGNVEDLYTGGSFVVALQALSKPILLKYKWNPGGKGDPTWKKATAAVVNILTASLPYLKKFQIRDKDDLSVWQEILASCHGIISADTELNDKKAQLSSDQDFDIHAFNALYDLLVPVLGSNLLTDRLRRSFAASIFQYSVIHEPHPDDLPRSGEEVLQNLNSEHIGRVQRLPPSPRSKVSYVLLDKLYDLVAFHDGSTERVKLAQAAAPYLILRVGITLKAYVLDHPLRGSMPQPASQRKELLYILQRLVELDSEPKGIPDAQGVVSDRKRHLYRVYGLVTKALRVARRDAEIQNALTKVIETIAEDFGV